MTRDDIKNVEVYRFVRQGAREVLMRLRDMRAFPPKPKVLMEKEMTAKQNEQMWLATIVDTCINDPQFLEGFLLEEPIVAFWDAKWIGGKEYRNLKLMLEKCTKKLTVNKHGRDLGEVTLPDYNRVLNHPRTVGDGK